jgi:hypothetical protein
MFFNKLERAVFPSLMIIFTAFVTKFSLPAYRVFTTSPTQSLSKSSSAEFGSVTITHLNHRLRNKKRLYQYINVLQFLPCLKTWASLEGDM